MDKRFIRAIHSDQIAAGGMKAVEIDGLEVVICNAAGTFRAIQRRCGHMNAPLEFGTLDGTIVTCGMHCVQFDVTTGHALCGPVPADLVNESLPPRVAEYLGNVTQQMAHIRTESIRTYETKVEAEWVHIAL